MKRILSLILALVLVISLAPAVQAAPARGFASSAGANPLYPHLEAPEPAIAAAARPNPAEPNAIYKTMAEAGADYREAMERRESTVNLYLRIDDPSFDPYTLSIPELMEYAFTETGVPTEGDSLRWVWCTYSSSWGWYETNTGYLLDVTIDMTYYTTAAQEQELRTKIDQILDSFGFTEDTSDYRKVKTIYDYITANVVYDYEHVNDESYKLQFTAYAAACQGVAVCQGYAVLFYQMLLKEGICARVITGWGGGPHAWNIVELENLFYNCDSTWDAGMAYYSWFLCSPADFPDHYREDMYETDDFHSRYPMDDENYAPPHEHTYGSWTVTEPTCTAEGKRTRTCSGCGNVDTEILPALGHDYTSSVTEPTCTEEGCVTHTCTRCGNVVTETQPALGHDYISIVTDPTCTDGGYTTHTCSRCADTYTDAYTEALGHSWDEGKLVKEPTESEAGLVVYTCTVCTATNEVVLDPHAHSYTETVVAPGCETPGYTLHTCAGCSHYYTDNYVAALGHTWEGPACSRCGGERPNPFADTSTSGYYYLPLLWALDNGITNGMTPTTFEPESTCTRGQVVTFLWRAAGCPEPEKTEHPFEDVTEDYYYKAMLWAVEKGITNGMTPHTFEPGTTCTRGQVVTFLWRAANKPEPTTTSHPFTDVTEDYYYDAMLWAVENGITNGMTPDTFAPGTTCTRGQVVTFLYRSFVE